MQFPSPSPVILTVRVVLNHHGIDRPDQIRLLLYHLSVINDALQNLRELQPRIAQSGPAMAGSIQQDRPFLDLLRDTLRKLQAEPEPETSNLEDLKSIIRERIADLEFTAPPQEEP